MDYLPSVGIILINIIIVLYLAVLTLTKTDTRKMVWYIPVLFALFNVLLGTLIIAVSEKGTMAAYNGTRVEQIGSYFLSPFMLFFTADYLKIKIPKIVKISMLSIPATFLILVWTTQVHGLFYVPFHIAAEDTRVAIDYLSGPMRFYPHIYSLLCMVISAILIISHLIKKDIKNRRLLVILLVISLSPAIMNLLVSQNVFGMKELPVNPTTLTLTISCMLLYYCIVQLNMFDIITKGMEMALTFTKEAFILIDSDNRFLLANEPAIEIFPELDTMKKYVKIDSIENIPFKLPEGSAMSERLNFELDGNRFYTASIDAIIDENDNMIGHIILISNISDVILLAKKAEEANKIKSNFLQDLSHEMKAPLTIIATGADYSDSMLRKEIPDVPAAREAIGSIQEETQRIGRMVGGMIEMASMSEITGVRDRVDFTELLRKSVEAFRLTLQDKNRLHMEIPDELPDVFVEADGFRQVIANLLSNAAEYTSGDITVKASTGDGYITVEIIDFGESISPELLPNIFKRGVSGKDGTGYGLSICKTIVEAHGGAITIENRKPIIKNDTRDNNQFSAINYPLVTTGTVVTFTVPVYGGQEVAHKE